VGPRVQDFVRRPVPCHFGIGLFTRTQKVIDVSSKSFSFRFHPDCVENFSSWGKSKTGHLFFQSLTDDVSQWSKEANGASILAVYPAIFSTVLGMSVFTPCVTELTDSTRVRSPHYSCIPPKLANFKPMVNVMLAQGVLGPSKSPNAIPAFLVPNSWGSYRMVLGYRKENSKFVFDSYPMPNIQEALDQFTISYVFCVRSEFRLFTNPSSC